MDKMPLKGPVEVPLNAWAVERNSGEPRQWISLERKTETTTKLTYLGR